MPLYEYRCECGNVSEALRSMAKRHESAVCRCGKRPELAVAPFSSRTAEYFTTVGSDGRVIGWRQTTEKIPNWVSPTGVEF